MSSSGEDPDSISAEIGGGQGHKKHLVSSQGVFFADVTANGTGCPAGTWDIAISEDGQTFTARFNAYEAQVAPGEAMAFKNCQIDIQLGSVEGLSYSVASFYYQGYAFLEKDGMRAHHAAAYFFKGKGENKADAREISGPFDDSYLFADDVGASRRVWSKCKRAETLHVKTALEMRNNKEASGAGYVNNATIDASLSLNWRLEWRRCH